MLEQRQVPRWQINKDVTIAGAGLEYPVWGRVRDINLKGMQLSLSGHLPAESPLRLRVAVGQELEFTAEVNIPWSRKLPGQYVYGVSFHRILDSDRDRIYEYVSTRCSEQFRQHWWEA